MKSAIVKRSVIIAGHKTSVSVEDAFWKELKAIAGERDMNLSELITSIDSDRQHGNLSSAIRLHVLNYYQSALKTSADSRTQPIMHRGQREPWEPWLVFENWYDKCSTNCKRTIRSAWTQSCLSAASEREPLNSGQFEIPLSATSNADQRKPGNLRELKKYKVILLAAEFDPQAFNTVQDKLDYAYTVKTDRERSAQHERKPRASKALRG
jgi:predicted DNA-binding ribbon-helix-helix protein